MKLTFVFWTAAFLQVSAGTTAQTVTCFVKKAKLETVFTVIEKQTGYAFFYRDQDLEKALPVTVELKNTPFTDALSIVFRGQPLSYTISGKTVVVSEKTPELKVDNHLSAAAPLSVNVQGRVLDERGDGVDGASIVLVGTSKGAIADKTGVFLIRDVNPGRYKIEITAIGYEKITGDIVVEENTDRIFSFQMKTLVGPLDGVVVGGNIIATQKKKIDIPVTTINSQQLQNSPWNGPQDLFRGLVPGASFLERPSGILANTIAIRGGTTTSGFNAIKTYIDGVEVSDPTYISMIDKNSIDHIEITRGPAGSTLYGSDASGGVIQIFTKKGSNVFERSLRLSGATGAISSKWVDGNPSQQKYNLNYQESKSGLSYNIGGSYERNKPWVPYDDIRKGSIYAGTRVNGTKTTLDITGRYLKNQYGPGSYVILKNAGIPFAQTPTPHPSFFTAKTLGVNFQYKPFRWWSHTVILGSDVNSFENSPDQPNPSTNRYSFNSYSSEKNSLRYFNTLIAPNVSSFRSTLTLGIEVTQTKVNQFVTSQFPTQYGIYNVTSATLNRQKINSHGYFAQWQPELWNKLFATAGIRFEKNDLFGENFGTAVSPRFGATTNFLLGKVLFKPRISYGVAIQSPTLYQKQGLLSGNTSYLPNPDISPLKQKGWDGGVNLFLAQNHIEIEIDYFSQHVERQIDVVQISGTTYQYQNVGEVESKGLENMLRYTSGGWSVMATYSVLFSNKVKKLSPTYSGDLKVGDNLPAVPLTTAGGNFSYQFHPRDKKKNNGWLVSYDLTLFGKRKNVDYVAYYRGIYGLDTYKGSRRAYWIDYSSLLKMNFSFEYFFNKYLSLFGQIRNLTNNYSPESSNYEEVMGRSWLAGFRLNLSARKP